MSMNINGMNGNQNVNQQAEVMWYRPELQQRQNGCGVSGGNPMYPGRPPMDQFLPQPCPQNPVQELVTVVKELINLVRGLLGNVTGANQGGEASQTGATQAATPSGTNSVAPTQGAEDASKVQGDSKNGQLLDELFKGIKKFLRPIMKEFDGGKGLWKGIAGIFDSFKGIWGSIFK